MTLETDGLIAFFRASGVEGVVTDLNTPHVHASNSYHYRPGTPSGVILPLDHDGGRVGLAVDLGLPVGRPDDPQYAKIFSVFAQVEGKLTEMFHSGPSITYFVKNGQRHPIAQLDRSVFAEHHNHVHVAVERGVILSATTSPSLPPEEEDDMPAQFKITCPTGGYWLVTRLTGGVYAEAGAPFFGSMAGKPMNASVVDLEPFVTNGQVAGYWLIGADGGAFGFGGAQVPDSYVAHPEWHGGARTIIGGRQHDPGYDLIAVEPDTDPPKLDVYDLSAKR